MSERHLRQCWMSKFLPNLPNDNVKTVVMSTEFQNISKAIGEVGIKILPTKPIEKFYPFEKSHADMQFFHYSSDTAFILKESLYLKEELEKYIENFIVIEETAQREYPKNVLLNAVSLKGNIICNPKCISDNISHTIEQKRTYVYRVGQGYTKCSTCIVTEDSIITSDKSIYNACKGDFDVLLIRPGFIDLPGTSYGFIGGCSFKYNKDILMFTGNIKNHPDYISIKNFCRNHNVYTESLVNDNLTDIGSVIPVE